MLNQTFSLFRKIHCEVHENFFFVCESKLKYFRQENTKEIQKSEY